MKYKIIIGSIICIIFLMLLCCCGYGMVFTNKNQKPKSTVTQDNQIKTMIATLEPKETPVPKLTTALKIKNNFSNLHNKLITTVYDVYEKEITTDSTTIVKDLFQDGMNYKFTFKDGSTLTIFCEYDNSKAGYIIKSIK